MCNGGNRHSCFSAFKLPIPHPAISCNGVHGVHLFAHILRQRDLAAGADEVVLRIIDLEVFIAQDVIIQKARGQLARQREAADSQRIYLRLRQRGGGFLYKTLSKRPVDVQVHARLVRLRAIFFHEIGGKPDRVAEVVPHQTGHHGVQINHYQGIRPECV